MIRTRTNEEKSWYEYNGKFKEAHGGGQILLSLQPVERHP